MDALQAGCHVFIEKPLSTNVQEAVDIVGLARARNRKVGVGHQFRLLPEPGPGAGELLAERGDRPGPAGHGDAGAALARVAPRAAEHSWRFDPEVAGGGILADAGDHLVDALLWTTGPVAGRGRGDPEPARLGARPGDGRRGPAGRRHAGDARRSRASRRARSSSSTYFGERGGSGRPSDR